MEEVLVPQHCRHDGSKRDLVVFLVLVDVSHGQNPGSLLGPVGSFSSRFCLSGGVFAAGSRVSWNQKSCTLLKMIGIVGFAALGHPSENSNLIRDDGDVAGSKGG